MSERAIESYRGNVNARLIIAIIGLLVAGLSYLSGSFGLQISGLLAIYVVAVITGINMIGALRRFAEERPDPEALPAIRFARLVLIGAVIASTFVALVFLAVLPYFFEPLKGLDFLIHLVDWLFPYFDQLVAWSTALTCAHYIAMLIASTRLARELGKKNLRSSAHAAMIVIAAVAIAQLIPMGQFSTAASWYSLTCAFAMVGALVIYTRHLSQLSDALEASPSKRASLPESRLVS